MILLTFTFVILTLFCEKSLSMYPNVPCPNIFRYVRAYDLDMGLIALENVNYGETVLEVELSQPGSLYPGMEGYLNLNFDENKISDYVRSGTPFTYKVNFPLKNVVPHVSAIRINGHTICYGRTVPPPSTTITLRYTLTVPEPFNFHQLYNQRGPSWTISPTLQTQYPSVPCPNVFRYVPVSDLDMGLITIDSLNYGVNVLELELSQAGSIYPGIEGYLNLNIDEHEVSEYLRLRRPITYKVNFPLKNVIPQVSAIRINGNTICFGPRVGAPSTTMTLTHTLTVPFPHNTDSGRYILRPPMRSPWVSATNNDSWPQFGNTNFNNPDFMQPKEESRNPFLSSNNGFRYNVTTPKTEISERQYYATENPPIYAQTIAPTSTTISPTTPTPQTTTTTTIKPEKTVSLEYINSLCGLENSDFREKTLNGDTIHKARFPWIVALFKKNLGTLSFQCGGSLISTRTVISAAHCFYSEFDQIKDENILVSMGRHNLTDWSDSYITHRDVEKIIRHPDYRPELVDIDADLAIVLLKELVSFSYSIRPVCLWQGPRQVREIVGVSGVVVGWGRDQSNSHITTAPRLVKVYIDSEITCIRSNRQMFYLTSNRTVCAGNRNGTSPCNGDSGSGLIMHNRNKWMIRGTVSAALGNAVNQCNSENYVVYTDIAMFVEWIKENMLL